MFGCSRAIAHSLVRRLEQTEFYIDAQDRRDIRKQRQDKTVNLHSRIDASGSSRHTPQRFIPESEQMLFDVIFYILTRYSFPTLQVKHTMLQLCFRELNTH